MKKYQTLSIVVAFLLSAGMAHAALTASFQPSAARMGESVSLVFVSDKPFKEKPDLSVLASDLHIAGQQQRQSSSWVNGVGGTTYELSYTVFPRKEGVIQTPPFSLNGETVAPAVLTISAASDHPDTAQSDEVSASLGMTLSGMFQTTTPYVGESVLYTVRLKDKVGLLDGEIRPPVISGAEVSVFGEDKIYQKREDGRIVTIFERTFLVTPTQSGSLTVTPATFFGVVPEQKKATSTRDPWDLFDTFGLLGQQKEVYLETPSEILNVQNKPANWQGWWVPGTKAVLKETWRLPSEIRVGDAIERTITLSVDHVMAERLPVPVQAGNSTLKVYPSPEKRSMVSGPDGVIGTVSVSVALVPTTAGSLTIPAVSVPWFNTQTGKREQAELPEKNIEVIPALAVSGEEGRSLKTTLADMEKEARRVEHLAHEPMVQVIETISIPFVLAAVFGGAFFGGLLVLLGMLLLQKRHQKGGFSPISRSKQKHQKKKALSELYPFK